MVTITISNIDESMKRRLRLQAAAHGRSMEEEARDILRAALSITAPPSGNLVETIRARFAPLGGADLSLVPREPLRQPIDLS